MSAVEPPLTWIRLSMAFHALSAALRRAVKSKLGFSVDRFWLALAMLTYDSATATWTTAADRVSKVTNAPVLVPLAEPEPLEIVPPDQVPCAVGARSNAIAKKIGNVFDEPQKPPAVSCPVTVDPEIVTEPLRLPVALRLVLIRICAVAVAG